VRRGQPAREVERDVEDLSPRHRVVELIERTAVHVLGDQVGMSVNLGDPIDRDDVGVLEPGDRARLFDDPRARGRIRGRMDELHGDRPVEQRVVREVDLAHRAKAQQAHEPVFLELVGRAPSGVDEGHDPERMRGVSCLPRSVGPHSIILDVYQFSRRIGLNQMASHPQRTGKKPAYFVILTRLKRRVPAISAMLFQQDRARARGEALPLTRAQPRVMSVTLSLNRDSQRSGRRREYSFAG